MLAEINLADAVNPSINRDAFDDLYVNSLIVVGAIRGVIAQKEAVGSVKLKRRLQKEDDASNILPLLCIPRLISLPVFFSKLSFGFLSIRLSSCLPKVREVSLVPIHISIIRTVKALFCLHKAGLSISPVYAAQLLLEITPGLRYM